MLANFTSLFDFVIHTNIVSGSYQSRAGTLAASDVLAVVPITVNPGGVAQYQTSWPNQVPLANPVITQISMFLTDTSNNPITDLLDQPWSVTLMIQQLHGMSLKA